MAELFATISLEKGFHRESSSVSERPAPSSHTGELLCTTRAREINPLPVCFSAAETRKDLLPQPPLEAV